MKIKREWAMPNSKTFKIKPIKELIKRYVKNSDLVIDPFANEYSIKNEIICKQYISLHLYKIVLVLSSNNHRKPSRYTIF